MRHAFVNQGGPKFPDRAKLAKYKISRLYYEARDPNLTGTPDDPRKGVVYLDELRSIPCTWLPPVNGHPPALEVGIMRDPGWTHSSMEDLAHEADADLSRLGARSKQLAVLFDIEWPIHDSALILKWLNLWRTLRPNRMTAWTPEFHQGGWFTKELVAAITSDPNLVVMPQAYVSDPPIVMDADLTRCDLTDRGVPKDRVGVFYLPGDVAHRESWDGAVFGFNELP